ncbi:LacI family DNA-binding transcriptional regulator [Arthrobacter sedimenti]|uniref:LacI family DNA-binding transcriptional regulator n=1 Tax=Arthrobacter sedimenti TaxID=2694931 RepID=UPI001CDD565E|nr:LacI family DNA-binding transcriptional regulator [Arthrobacter sedimenti]
MTAVQPASDDPAVAPSMNDVARRAGVSLGTVSHVLNKPEIVSAKTIARVAAAIDELGFVRNDAARSLAAGRSNTVGLILTDVGNSLFVDIARGAEGAASSAGRSLLLANSDVTFQKQESYLDIFDEARVAGIILAPLDAGLDGVDRVRRHGRNIVLVNYAGDRTDCCSVVVDEEHGGYLAATHLMDIGRSRLLFAGGPEDLHAVNARREGARRAVRERGNGVSLEVIPSRNLKSASGRSIARQLLDDGALPDGILAPADQLAAGLIHELTDAGVSVPGDVAVIGYDNNQFASEAAIPMSTVSQPGHEMGEEALRLLLDEIDNPRSHEHRRITLDPSLIVRRSTVSR